MAFPWRTYMALTFLRCWFRSDEVSLAVSAAAIQARAAIDDQERRLLDDLATSKNDRTRQLDNHIAACDLQVLGDIFSNDN